MWDNIAFFALFVWLCFTTFASFVWKNIANFPSFVWNNIAVFALVVVASVYAFGDVADAWLAAGESDFEGQSFTNIAVAFGIIGAVLEAAMIFHNMKAGGITLPSEPDHDHPSHKDDQHEHGHGHPKSAWISICSYVGAVVRVWLTYISVRTFVVEICGWPFLPRYSFSIICAIARGIGAYYVHNNSGETVHNHGGVGEFFSELFGLFYLKALQEKFCKSKDSSKPVGSENKPADEAESFVVKRPKNEGKAGTKKEKKSPMSGWIRFCSILALFTTTFTHGFEYYFALIEFGSLVISNILRIETDEHGHGHGHGHGHAVNSVVPKVIDHAMMFCAFVLSFQDAILEVNHVQSFPHEFRYFWFYFEKTVEDENLIRKRERDGVIDKTCKWWKFCLSPLIVPRLLVILVVMAGSFGHIIPAFGGEEIASDSMWFRHCFLFIMFLDIFFSAAMHGQYIVSVLKKMRDWIIKKICCKPHKQD